MLVVGHSFVRHLKTHMSRKKIANLELDPTSMQATLVSGIDRSDKINMIRDASDRAKQIVEAHPPPRRGDSLARL